MREATREFYSFYRTLSDTLSASTRRRCCDRTRAASRFAVNQIGDTPPNLVKAIGPVRRRGSAQAALCSAKETVRRVGIERCQSRIEAEPRPAVGTEDRVRPAHIDVDVRVVLRRGFPDALEFPHSDADFGDAAVVPELQIAAAGHQFRLL